MTVFNTNTDDVAILRNKLERLHKSGYPVAVRQTLDGAAFDMKKRTMPKSAENNFTQRKKNFFRAFSRVDKAKGFNVRKMQAVMGFRGDPKGKDAVENIQKQEEGGKIEREFVPLKEARIANSANRMVAKKNRAPSIKNVVDAHNADGKNDAERFIKSAIHAGKNGYVLGTFRSGSGGRILYRINSLKQKGGRTVVNAKGLYSYKNNRTFSVEETNFLGEASKRTARRIPKLFRQNAERQFKRLLSK